MKKLSRAFLCLVGLMVGLQSQAFANNAVPFSEASFQEAGLIPVHSGGRIKPFDSFARETVLFITGSRSWQNWNPTDLLLSWMVHPRVWQQEPLIKVGVPELRRQLLLDESRTRFSIDELIKNPALIQYAEEMSSQGDPSGMQALQSSSVVPQPGMAGKPSARDRELRSVLDRIGLFRAIVSAEALQVIPREGAKGWTALGSEEGGASGKIIRGLFADWVGAYQKRDVAEFDRLARLTRAAIEGEVTGFEASGGKRLLFAEWVYNVTRPFFWSMWVYLVAAALWTGALLSEKKWLKGAAWITTGMGMLIHLYGFSLRCWIAGRPPVSNMYESVIWVSLGVIAFALIIYRLHGQAIILASAVAVAGLTLLAGDSAPAVLDPSIQPLVPVLRSNFWLTIHVLTITLGYAAFALSLGVGNITLYQYLKGGAGLQSRVLGLNLLSYRAMQFGVVLLAAGTILGGVWADYSWGRFWGWDPKEVWALIALLTYLVILHGRYAGWVGQFGFAALSVLSFMSVVMAWYGVNFVLGVGLHSYGFSNGGGGAVGVYVLFQSAFVGLVTLIRTRRLAQASHPASTESAT